MVSNTKHILSKIRASLTATAHSYKANRKIKKLCVEAYLQGVNDTLQKIEEKLK